MKSTICVSYRQSGVSAAEEQKQTNVTVAPQPITSSEQFVTFDGIPIKWC